VFLSHATEIFFFFKHSLCCPRSKTNLFFFFSLFFFSLLPTYFLPAFFFFVVFVFVFVFLVLWVFVFVFCLGCGLLVFFFFFFLCYPFPFAGRLLRSRVHLFEQMTVLPGTFFFFQHPSTVPVRSLALSTTPAVPPVFFPGRKGAPPTYKALSQPFVGPQPVAMRKVVVFPLLCPPKDVVVYEKFSPPLSLPFDESPYTTPF